MENHLEPSKLENQEISIEEMKNLTASFFIEYISDEKHQLTDSEQVRTNMIDALDALETSSSIEEITQILSQFKPQLEETIKAKRDEKITHEKLLGYIR